MFFESSASSSFVSFLAPVASVSVALLAVPSAALTLSSSRSPHSSTPRNVSKTNHSTSPRADAIQYNNNKNKSARYAFIPARNAHSATSFRGARGGTKRATKAHSFEEGCGLAAAATKSTPFRLRGRYILFLRKKCVQF